MGAWHQIANATATIAFAISLFIASQMYVASRLSAGELEKSPVQKLRSVAYRTPRDL
jgi:hypothetical protein